MGSRMGGGRISWLPGAGMGSCCVKTRAGHMRSPGGARAINLAAILQVPAGACLSCLLWWNDLIPHMTGKL